jgi:hypothetical protein
MKANFERLGRARTVKESDEMMLSLGVRVTLQRLSSRPHDRSVEKAIHNCKRGADDD